MTYGIASGKWPQLALLESQYPLDSKPPSDADLRELRHCVLSGIQAVEPGRSWGSEPQEMDLHGLELDEMV